MTLGAVDQWGGDSAVNVIGVDTSVAVPLLVQTHEAHRAVVRWWAGRDVALCGQALAETYAVLTRLPGDLRVRPADAAQLIEARFAAPLTLRPETAMAFPRVLADAGVAGGAVYDALIALAAADNDVALATRDVRARGTYDVMGARVLMAG